MREFAEELEDIKEQSLYRKLRTVLSPQGAQVMLKTGNTINFSSNDYLGFANHPALKEAFAQAVAQFGTGSGSSRLICGTQGPHEHLEQQLARFKDQEAALSFSTGYATATGTMGALLRKGDIAILDKLCHACLIDGARLSGATVRVFPHNRVDKLTALLEKGSASLAKDARILVVTESIFSMDGDAAPLKEIAALKQQFPFLLMVDEAHGTGVFGAHGAGLSQQHGLSKAIDVHMGTLGKALGVSGGFVCGSHQLRELLINRARSFIFSTAPGPALAATAAHAIRLVQGDTGHQQRRKLQQNLNLFASLMDTGRPTSPIIPRILGDEDVALRKAQQLLDSGLLVPAIRYPTVSRGAARLRITLTAGHTPEQITALVQALGQRI